MKRFQFVGSSVSSDTRSPCQSPKLNPSKATKTPIRDGDNHLELQSSRSTLSDEPSFYTELTR